MNDAPSKHSVLLMDMGGPQTPAEVRPYLQRIFFDPYIIPGNPIKRWLLSQLIASKSAAETRERYAEIGGKSNAVPNAQKLGEQLKKHFADQGIELEYEVATRYSFPTIPQGLAKLSVKQKAPISAVYLYPHETSALTGSCVSVLNRAAKKQNSPIDYHVKNISRTPAYLQGWANAIKQAVKNPAETIIIFTAHSLPNSIIASGDRYVDEVEESVEKIKAMLGDVATDLAYQSQEGDDWLGPTAEEKAALARENGFKELIVAPLSFVGDNTETLLDIDKNLSNAIKPLGFERFHRITPPDQQGFLCEMVAEALAQEWNLESGS
ncbi:MAG: ferrochelatase [Planctomycetaceae bacterium]|nr:ferrochelatase [Planctomycetaceae bacterium]